MRGTPIALGASSASKQRWKTTVKNAGQERARLIDELGLLFPQPVALTIYYFPPAPMEGDVDNIVKPIMDAMIGVAYVDDKIVERVIVQKFEPQVEWEFVSLSDELAHALDIVSQAATPVVYIRVDADESWRKVR